MKKENFKKSFKNGCKKIKNFVGDHKYAFYAAYNTFGVAIPDVIAMNSVTDWNAAISPDAGIFGISPYDYYKALFLGIRLAPIAGYYIKNRKKKGTLAETSKLFETFLWTRAFQDPIFYGLQGINPISPFPDNPYTYPFNTGSQHVSDYIMGELRTAGAYSFVTRGGKLFVDKVKEKLLEKNLKKKFFIK
jgi:hypothetical protein